MAERFIVITSQVVGSGSFVIEHFSDRVEFTARKAAIRHGFKSRGSDDFNIGVVRAGKLVAVDWMDQPCETDPAVVVEIGQEIGL